MLYSYYQGWAIIAFAYICYKMVKKWQNELNICFTIQKTKILNLILHFLRLFRF